MLANTNSILSVGNRFYQKKKYNYAIKAYQKGAKLLQGEYPFAFELAKVYEAQGNISAVSEALISILDFSEEYQEDVQIALTTYLNDDSNGKKRRVFKETLLLKAQKNPNNTSLTELLIWLFVQEKKILFSINTCESIGQKKQRGW